jgi:hypothetical protein
MAWKQHMIAAHAHQDVAKAHVAAAEHDQRGEAAKAYDASCAAHSKSRDAHDETDKAHGDSASELRRHSESKAVG